MSELKWIANVPNISKVEVRVLLQKQDLEQISQLMSKNIVGEPKGTEKITVEQFKAMNMVGIYSKEVQIKKRSPLSLLSLLTDWLRKIGMPSV
ncbi:hypothetical protein [Anabaena azotica]|uniref:Uncharacterized protein n=1 Tax=Anabaena azotica FACHB-119 TaxID=947527 RepID=A0ABR8DE01_9NOST|nr:hypothetical protein [Anabaena azotica]MBD2503948.1 hypothetical protein [Anabaena azotica FACHB-119]